MNRLVAVTVMTALISSGAEPYRELYRPQYHFSPKRNWTNDPCGIVYANGEYHLFFQFNPFGDLWGHMSWGHAVSHDLIRTVAPLDFGMGPLNLHIFVDRSSLDVFSDDGQLAITNLVFPKPESNGISLHVVGGDVNDLRVHLWNLHSIWNEAKE